MKKVIFGTALASMALLSACSSDNELANVETTANNAIGFHVVGNKAETRAKIIDNSNITDTDFRVFAFTRNSEDGSDVNAFMGEKEDANGQTGVKIDHTKGTWDYANASDLHYWPTSTALNFYAVSPASVSDNMFPNFYWSIGKDSKTISYSSIDEYNNSLNEVNYDVMYAVAENQIQSKNKGKVTFNFKHIMSQVVFQAKTQYADMQVDIQDIKIHNYKFSGTFTFPTNGKDPEQSNWIPQSVSNKLEATVGKAQTTISVTSNTTTTDISLNKPMLFIPQKLDAWDTKNSIDQANKDTKSFLEIECKIQQNGEFLHGTATSFAKLYVPFGTSWAPGKRYVYTLIFGGGYDEHGQSILMPINFEAKTSDWVNAADSDINI